MSSDINIFVTVNVKKDYYEKMTNRYKNEISFRIGLTYSTLFKFVSNKNAKKSEAISDLETSPKYCIDAKPTFIKAFLSR